MKQETILLSRGEGERAEGHPMEIDMVQKVSRRFLGLVTYLLRQDKASLATVSVLKGRQTGQLSDSVLGDSAYVSTSCRENSLGKLPVINKLTTAASSAA